MSRSTTLHRALDRYLGIPLAIILGAISTHKTIPKEIRSIGFLQPTAIGDLILSSGVMQSASEAHPQAVIHLFHGSANKDAVHLLRTPVVAHCCDFRHVINIIRELRSHRLDLLIDLTPWPRTTALISWLASAKCTIGFQSVGQHRHFPFDIAVPHRFEVHETENLAEIAKVFGTSIENYQLSIRNSFQKPSIDLPYERLIVMHAFPGGSRREAKSWPFDYWIKLARAVIDAGWIVALSGTSHDVPKVRRMIEVVDRKEGCLPLAGLVNLDELAYIIQNAALTVSVDTGILHLAASINARVVGLHGPTASWRWGALNPRAKSLDASHPSAGYIHLGFESVFDELDVMKALAPCGVISEVMNLLDHN